MEYLKATFTLNATANDMQAAKDLLADLATEAGFEAFEEEDERLVGYVQTQMFDKQVLDEVIGHFPIASARIAYEVVEAENRNWNEAWEAAGFEPIAIDGRCVVYDARHCSPSNSPSETALKVYIEPRQAFGTGGHETTQMVLRCLLDMDLKGKRVLDCGCGTGILGIVASRLGAESVLGYDIDEWSVNNSLHNANLNGVRNITVRQGSALSLSDADGLFGVVVANINRNIILADLPLWVERMAKGATIVLSGFYTNDVPLLTNAAEGLGLTSASQHEQEGWACLTFGKK